MKQKPVYKLFVRLVLFIIVMIILDISIGATLKYIAFNQKSGNYFKIIDCIENKKPELIILGNSRAERQIIPSIITEESGVKSYNLGYGGRDLQFVEALTTVITKRTTPKYLLVELQYSDLQIPIKHERLSLLNPFYYKYSELKPYLNRGEYSRELAYNSALFQFNSSTWDIVSPYFRENELELGYRPLFGELNSSKIKLNSNVEVEESIQMLIEVQEIFEDIIGLVKEKDIKLVIVMSPQYKLELNTNRFQAEKKYLSQFNEILIWDYSQVPDFTNKSELYNDLRHLNHRGSKAFTKLVAQRIKNELL